jgi:hypothetical protein
VTHFLSLRLAVVAALTAVTLVALAPAATAVALTGEVTATATMVCGIDADGLPTASVSSVLHNGVNFPITVSSVDYSGAVTVNGGSFTPAVVAVSGTSEASMAVPADTVGLVHITWTYIINAQDPTATADVTLDGSCATIATLPVVTVTTVRATSTTAPPAAAAAVAAQPSFTG